MRASILLTFSLAIALFGLTGCAGLLTSQSQGVDSSYENTADENDPIVRAASLVRESKKTSAPASSAPPSPQVARRLARAVETSDLVLGLPMDQVRESWGEPAQIELSQNSGYQRWTYYEGLSSPWSVSPARVVYFDQGVVSGWETTGR